MRRRHQQSQEEAEESQSPRRDRSRQRFPQNEENDESEGDANQMHTQQNQQSSANRNPIGSAAQIACRLRSVFLQFWGSVKHEKGFVFTKQQRTAMITEQKKLLKKIKNHIVIQWTQECQWDQEEELRKIRKIFDQQQLNLPQTTIALLQDIFFKTSFLFGSETTEQLYRLLMEITKIQINDGQNQDKNAIIHQYMEMLLKGNNFKFFNYQFSNKFRLSPNIQANFVIYKTLGEKLAEILHPSINLQ